MFGPGAVLEQYYWQQLFLNLPNFFFRKARLLKDGYSNLDGTWVPPEYAIFPGSEAIAQVMSSQLDITTHVSDKRKSSFWFMNERLFYLFISNIFIYSFNYYE